MFRHIRWRIAVPYVILIGAAMGILSAHLLTFVRTSYLENLKGRMASEASLLRELTSDAVRSGDTTAIAAQADAYSSQLNLRVTVIAADGAVLADSATDPASMDNHVHRPEVQDALADGEGSGIRFSNTVKYDMMYYAVPLRQGGQVIAFLRVAVPLAKINADVAGLRRDTRLGIWLALAIAVGLAILIAERTARPIRSLNQVVRRISDGDLDTHLVPSTRDEVGELTQSVNEMSEWLRTTLESLDRERAELAAVLDNMADGVLILDPDGAVVLMNPAASRLLNTDASDAFGRSLAQVVRQHEIIGVWQDCQQQGTERVELVDVERDRLFVQVIVAPLGGAAEGTSLMILQDLRHLRHLEMIRRDFVGNVSHELRTPLASLKALSETLRDGALEDPPAARGFLAQIDTQVDTLTQMTAELLELSRIESGRVPMRLQPVNMLEAVVPAIERLMPQVDRSGLELTLDAPDDLPNVLGDVERLEQVITNLVHNAIKFTADGGKVRVMVRATDDEVVTSIGDTGIGIPEDALPRIFERFYKGDRSRSEAGTGLGLAISKHIVQGHGGRIWATSTEGIGSTFYFSVLRADGAGVADPNPSPGAKL